MRLGFISNKLNRKSGISEEYTRKCRIPSDINEHLPTLHKYAGECNHITECGVRSVISSYAFAHALRNKINNKLIQIDINSHENITNFQHLCFTEGVNTVFYEQSDLDCPIEPTELLFIDTWHVYGQLKRELERWNKSVSKYIILHDTTVDEWQGESVRLNNNIIHDSKVSGFSVEDITKGLWPAVEEFLRNTDEWILYERFTNNNGLTILKRIIR